METMGQKLIALRQAKELSQESLAKLAGLSQTTVSRLEKGEQVASTQTLAKLARALGARLAELVPAADLTASEGDDDTFYSFCANAFCSRNKIAKKDGQETVYWESWQPVSAEKWPDVNFCRSCGGDLVKDCEGCGMRVTEKGGRFCVRCGQRLTQRPTQEEWTRIKKELQTDFDDDIPF